MEGQSGATGLQLKVISFGPKLTRAKEIASGGGNGPALIVIKMHKKVVTHNIITTTCPCTYVYLVLC